MYRSAQKGKIKVFALILACVLCMLTVLPVYAEGREVDVVSARNAVIAEVSDNGNCTLTRKGNTMKALAGMRLVDGDALETSKEGRIYVLLDNSSVVRLDENSRATLRSGAMKKICIELLQGHLFYDVPTKMNDEKSIDFAALCVSLSIRGTSGFLSVGRGAVEHMLFDGEVSIDYQGEKIVSTSGQKIAVNPSPTGGTLESDLKVKEFTISEVPASVISEMMLDNVLKERVMKSIPVNKDDAGNPVYGTLETRIEGYGVPDAAAFTETNYVGSATIKHEDDTPERESAEAGASHEADPGAAAEPEDEHGTGSEEKTEQNPKTEEEQKTEPQHGPGGEQEPAEERCPYCGKTVTDENRDQHVIVQCDCGAEYCAMDEQESTKHELFSSVVCDICGRSIRKCNVQEHFEEHMR